MLLQRFHVPCISHFLIDERTSSLRLPETGGILRPQVRGKILGDEEKEALNLAEIELKTKEFLEKKIITDESGPDGFVVAKVLLIPKLLWDKEVSLTLGFNPQGDVRVQVKEGEKIFSEIVTERRKLFRFQLTRLVSALHVSYSLKQALAQAIDDVVAAFFQFDANGIEIDPFIVTDQESLLAYRVRMSVDERALYRQKEIRELLSARQETERERLTKSTFPYIIGDGNIGCLANGKGLAAYTALEVRKSGGTVAGMVDIGEVCTPENIIAGLNLLSRDPAVKCVCINLLTGLLDGQIIVSAILKAFAAIRGKFFLRLEGTNASGGCAVAKGSNILNATTSLHEAAQMAVAASKG